MTMVRAILGQENLTLSGMVAILQNYDFTLDHMQAAYQHLVDIQQDFDEEPKDFSELLNGLDFLNAPFASIEAVCRYFTDLFLFYVKKMVAFFDLLVSFFVDFFNMIHSIIATVAKMYGQPLPYLY